MHLLFETTEKTDEHWKTFRLNSFIENFLIGVCATPFQFCLSLRCFNVSWEFLRIENNQIKTAQNNSCG